MSNIKFSQKQLNFIIETFPVLVEKEPTPATLPSHPTHKTQKTLNFSQIFWYLRFLFYADFYDFYADFYDYLIVS